MAESASAPTSPKIIPQYIVLAASLIFAAVGSYVGMNREDTKSITDAVQAIDRRVTTIEAKMSEGRLRRDEQIAEIRQRLDRLEPREGR